VCAMCCKAEQAEVGREGVDGLDDDDDDAVSSALSVSSLLRPRNSSAPLPPPPRAGRRPPTVTSVPQRNVVLYITSQALTAAAPRDDRRDTAGSADVSSMMASPTAMLVGQLGWLLLFRACGHFG